MKKFEKANKSGKAAVVIIVVILLIVAIVGGLLYFGYTTLVKSGNILEGTYTGDNGSIKIDMGESSYTMTIDGTEENGKISDLKFDTKKTTTDSAVAYTAKFDGDGTYDVVIEIDSSTDTTKLTLKSDKFSGTDYCFNEDESK